MTIAAGFNFDSGVLLCADTKHTGQMALYESKILGKQYASKAVSLFAISGNVSYARMAVRRCESAINKLPHPSLDDMAAAIESSLVKIHRLHIDKHPDRNVVGGPDFWLLVALWSPVDGLRTYYTNQTSIDPFAIYQCMGTGEYLGHYLIRPRYTSPQQGLNNAVIVACTALQRIKSYDADCGGNSEFIVLRDNGELSLVHQFDISEAEKFAPYFFEMADFLFQSICNLDAPADQVKGAFETFESYITRERNRHLAERDQVIALWKALQTTK